MAADFRVERDSMGELQVPASALVGCADAARGQQLSDQRPAHAAGVHPRAGARQVGGRAHQPRLGPACRKPIADAIEASALEVANGMHEDQFPIDVFQTGSGTSSNMNANEVIARLATRALGSPVHPNDHVNMSQSSNDSIPSAIHIAAALELTSKLLPALEHLAATIEAKAREVAGIVKTGRTHLMDAMPVRLDQELGGWAAQVRADMRRLAGRDAAAHGSRAGRHGRRHGHQRASEVRRRVRGRAREADRHRLPSGRGLLRGAEQPGYGRRAVRPAQDDGGQHHEDRERPALDEQRPARRPRRDRAAGSPARQQHHAGQGEPRDPRGGRDGRGASHRQRRDDHDRGPVRQLPVERHAARHRAEPAAEHRAARERCRRRSRTPRSRASRSTSRSSTTRSSATRFS